MISLIWNRAVGFPVRLVLSALMVGVALVLGLGTQGVAIGVGSERIMRTDGTGAVFCCCRHHTPPASSAGQLNLAVGQTQDVAYETGFYRQRSRWGMGRGQIIAAQTPKQMRLRVTKSGLRLGWKGPIEDSRRTCVSGRRTLKCEAALAIAIHESSASRCEGMRIMCAQRFLL